MRIHRQLGKIDNAERINAWVFQITRNLVVDHYRSKARAAKELADDLDSDNEEENLNELVAGWLPQMISQLPEKYREAVKLYELKSVPQ